MRDGAEELMGWLMRDRAEELMGWLMRDGLSDGVSDGFWDGKYRMVYLMEGRKVDGKTSSGMERIGWYI